MLNRRNVLISVVVIGLLAILIEPNIKLLRISFDPKLLIYTATILFLSGAAAFMYFRSGLTDTLIATVSIIFALLFFSASAAQDDLNRINMLSGVSFYNCNVASGILNAKSGQLDYSQYRVDELIENLGFAHEIFAGSSDKILIQGIYDMEFANRLSDQIIMMNTSKDADSNMKALLADAQQIKDLSKEIQQIIQCPSF
jgi:hypothetical protein